jgi:hypothetical protein
MNGLRDEYFRTLGFAPNGASAKPRLEAALARAYQQRSFEIEHYWKRATYFWGFQIAIFAAFGLLLSKDPSKYEGAIDPVTVALAGLGFLTALANSFSARGSKFWQENWENHIDMLEDAIEGSLYKMVWLQDGNVSYSVSGVNKALSDCFAVFWLLIDLFVSWKFVGLPSPLGVLACIAAAGPYLYVLFVAFLIVLGFLWLSCHTTGLKGILSNAGGSRGRAITRRSRWSKIVIPAGSETFVRRPAPDEREAP